MTASDLYSQTLASLTNTRMTMLSPAWQELLDDGTPIERLEASKKLLEVQHAITVLSNAVLSDIAKEMANEESSLLAATQTLNKVVAVLNEVDSVLTSVTEVLDVVAKIVPLF